MIVGCGQDVARPQFRFTEPGHRAGLFAFWRLTWLDYFTRFSCVLDLGTPDNAARALDLYPACMEQAVRAGALGGGFLASVHPDQSGTKLWMRDCINGDPLQVILFVQLCAEIFGLAGQ
jgi:hypothetical protein